MLEVEHLKVAYGKAIALADMSLRVNEQELVTLLGANGAGKSTLLRTISGVNRPLSGRILYQDREIHQLKPHQIVKMGITQVPEGRAIFPDLTVTENLKMGAFTRTDEKGVAGDMAFVLELFPRLSERKNQAAGTLSGGEAQMLAIARGLLAAPKLLMLDEPSLGLAPVLREIIFKTIQKIHYQQGLTILLVEQNARWALQVAARAYIIENGRVTIEGIGKDLIDNDHVKQAFLGY